MVSKKKKNENEIAMYTYYLNISWTRLKKTAEMLSLDERIRRFKHWLYLTMQYELSFWPNDRIPLYFLYYMFDIRHTIGSFFYIFTSVYIERKYWYSLFFFQKIRVPQNQVFLYVLKIFRTIRTKNLIGGK